VPELGDARLVETPAAPEDGHSGQGHEHEALPVEGLEPHLDHHDGDSEHDGDNHVGPEAVVGLTAELFSLLFQELLIGTFIRIFFHD